MSVRDVSVRPAAPDDALTLRRLAALDSKPVPVGEVLIAEVDGEAWAAVAVHSGEVVADPFRPTAELIARLRESAGIKMKAPPEALGVGDWIRLAAGVAGLDRLD